MFLCTYVNGTGALSFPFILDYYKKIAIPAQKMIIGWTASERTISRNFPMLYDKYPNNTFEDKFNDYKIELKWKHGTYLE